MLERQLAVLLAEAACTRLCFLAHCGATLHPLFSGFPAKAGSCAQTVRDRGQSENLPRSTALSPGAHPMHSSFAGERHHDLEPCSLGHPCAFGSHEIPQGARHAPRPWEPEPRRAPAGCVSPHGLADVQSHADATYIDELRRQRLRQGASAKPASETLSAEIAAR